MSCTRPSMLSLWKDRALQKRMPTEIAKLSRHVQRCTTPTILPPTNLVSTTTVLLSLTKNGPCQQRKGQADPTRMMQNIIVIPHEGGQPFEFEACPDTGCTKTIIPRNLAIRKGMRFNPDSNLKIRSGQFRLGYIHPAISGSIHRSQHSGFGRYQRRNPT